MLSRQHFYYELFRKYVIVFGNMFNDITLKKLNTDGSEIERIKVPISYGPREKYVTRLQSDPDLYREVQAILPRMSFEIDGISYDAGRKQNTMLRVGRANTSTGSDTQYMGVPYDISMTLQIYARNTSEGTQIVEQILPYFTPAYTVTLDTVPDLGFLKDFPIILNSVNESTEYEGNYDSIRFINWALNFTIKGYFYGPIQPTKIIRTVITNIYNDPSIVRGYITRINTANTSGSFKIGDTVYQGTRYDTATAYGIVNEWNANTGVLQLGAVQGNFKVNNTITAVSTNGTSQIASFVVDPLKLAKITITPDPIDALPTDDFGYTTVIEEFPNINE